MMRKKTKNLIKSKSVRLSFVFAFLLFSIHTFGFKVTPKTEGPDLICPSDERVILDNRYPVNTVYVGFWDYEEQIKLIDTIVESAKLSKTQVDVIVPASQFWSGYQWYKKQKDKKYVKLLFSQGEDSIWTQDYMQFTFNTKTHKETLLELPYDDSPSKTAAQISIEKKVDFIPVHQSVFDKAEFGSGDFGGNIEALNDKIVLVGDNMLVGTKKRVEMATDQKVLTLSTAWLEPGHVDELFTTIPSKSSCGYSVLYASPRLAIDMLKSNVKNRIEKFAPPDGWSEEIEDREKERVSFDECLQKYNWKVGTGLYVCKELVRANLKYHSLILKNVEKIRSELKLTKSCRDVEFVPMPVLFSPKLLAKNYGTNEDYAIALNINPVNGILLGKSYITGDQGIAIFGEYVKKVFDRLGVKIRSVGSTHLHMLRGGVHCTTNLLRTCR